jgi:hypothetical protein
MMTDGFGTGAMVGKEVGIASGFAVGMAVVGALVGGKVGVGALGGLMEPDLQPRLPVWPMLTRKQKLKRAMKLQRY